MQTSVSNAHNHVRSVLITGAARGIGRATALCLAEAGYRLALLDRDRDALDRVHAEILKTSLSNTLPPMLFVASVTDELALATICQQIEEANGLDVVVNSAGVGLMASVTETTPDRWRHLLDVNLTGTFLVCSAAIPHMLRRGHGQIINIASLAGKVGFPMQSAYCASKWGVLGLTRALSAELRAQGIRLTALCPGAVDTPFWATVEHRFDPAHMLRPEQIAETIRFLIEQPASLNTDEIEILPAIGTL